MKKTLKILVIAIAILLFSSLFLFIFRKLSPLEIDDITPGIPCLNQQNLIMQSQTLWIIPDFNGIPISNNKTWCKKILTMNKTLGLHGVMHTYDEFGTDRDQNYLENGIKIFENCFSKKPTEFKAPQLDLSEKNRKLILKNNMDIKGLLNQITHRVYHCNDSGKFSNKFIKLF